MRAVDEELQPDPAEQVVAGIRDLHAAGASLREIARTLDAEGVPPRRKGTRWQDRSVGRIVARL